MRCPTCRTENDERSKFCFECGARLATIVVSGKAERRQITVLFCDLVGSTAMSEVLDPEDLRDVIQQYQASCAALVARFDGTVAQYLGDGLLVYFGYPSAHEDDGQRAVRAGLEIRDAVSQFSAGGRPLKVRIGIHTGLVVVGEVGAEKQQLAIGETPNLAARIQQAATPGTVVISESAHRLVRGFFQSEDLGWQELPGLSQQVRLYRVDCESGAQSRLEAAAATGLTPYVGRSESLRSLRAALEGAEQGRGCIVTVRGEAGIGKSRLLEEFKSSLDGRCVMTECRCTPYQQNSPLFPFLKLLEERLDFANATSGEQKVERLQTSLVSAGLHAADALPVIARLLSLPMGAQPERQLSPVKQRQIALELLGQWLANVARVRPLLLIVEDIHWADPTTLEFISMLIDREPVPGLVTVLTFRPELTPPWRKSPQLIELDLSPLSASDARTLVSHVASDKALPSDILALVVARAGGIPLYVEEITKAVIESGVLLARADRYELTGPLPAGLIPTTVKDSLSARIDHVGSAKPVAQLAATLGQEFGYDVLRAVSQQDDELLQRDLQRLLDAGLIFVQARPPHAAYAFKHALIRDAAYESLLRKTRQEYHRDIAQTLKSRFPAVAERQPELMAHHCEGAGLVEEALEYWGRAIEFDKARAANKETVAHVGRALELVRAMPRSVDRSRRELQLQLSLGPALTAMKGWSSPEVHQAYTRAGDACREMGNTEELFPVLWGLWSYHLVSGDHKSASPLAEQAFRAVGESGNLEFVVPAMHAIGYAHYFGARYAQALAVARKGIPLYNPEREREVFRQFQIASSAALRDQAGTALWALGYPDQGREVADQGLAVTKALGNSTAAAFGASMLAWGVSRLLRDAKRVRHLAEEVMRLSSEEEFSFWPPLMRVFHGWARCEEGDAEAAVDVIRAGFKEYRAMGGGVLGTSCLVHLAEALLKAGRHEEGLDTIAEALEFVEVSGETHFEQEVYRVKGELLRARAERLGRDGGALIEAEASFERGIQISRSQGARSFELRGAMSLSRLWQRRGKDREAAAMLEGVYGTFTEGFDTPDLRDARALLEELGAK